MFLEFFGYFLVKKSINKWVLEQPKGWKSIPEGPEIRVFWSGTDVNMGVFRGSPYLLGPEIRGF